MPLLRSKNWVTKQGKILDLVTKVAGFRAKASKNENKRGKGKGKGEKGKGKREKGKGKREKGERGKGKRGKRGNGKGTLEGDSVSDHLKWSSVGAKPRSTGPRAPSTLLRSVEPNPPSRYDKKREN